MRKPICAKTIVVFPKIFAIISLLTAILACTSHGTIQAGASNATMIASYDKYSREAAKQVLAEGGNVFDAFVAATLAEFVTAPGFTSLAGSLGVLVHDAKTKTTAYLDAGFNAVSAPDGIYDPAHPVKGKAILIPGALRGLETLWKRFGHLPWDRLVEPARRLAADGFLLNKLYASTIGFRSRALKETEYGRRTFFPAGVQLKEGDILRQTDLACFLEQVQNLGADAMYLGPWADQFVEVANSAGGKARKSDLSRYAAEWKKPWTVSYKGFQVDASSGRSFGGLWALLFLKVLEYGGGDSLTEVDRYERIILTIRALYDEMPWMLSASALDDPAFVSTRLSTSYISKIWARVKSKLAADDENKSSQPNPAYHENPGAHSFHLAVVDRYGNAATGINTIVGSLWGDGLFVRGVPLTSSGRTTAYIPGPGQKVFSPYSLHLVFRNGQLRMASGTFNFSLVEAEAQLLLAVLGGGLNAREAVLKPRFGTAPYDFKAHNSPADWSKNWIDPNFPKDVKTKLEQQGLSFVPGDTGIGSIILRSSDGTLEGASSPYRPLDAAAVVFY